MIGVLLRFQFDTGFDVEKLQKIAGGAREKFVGLAGLRSKAFTYDAKAKEAINFYVWDDQSVARNFFTEAFVERVAGVYGVRPSIQFVEVAELVDNGPSAAA